MINVIADIGSIALGKLIRMGEALLMLLQAIVVKPKLSSISRLIQQLYIVGVQSLVIILV
jgi:phospholipid/cholesterol/gamma-HCH transport system permease protein